MEVLVDGSACVVYVNDSVAMSARLYNRRSGAPDTEAPEIASDLGRYLREKIYHHRDAIVRVEELEMHDAEVAMKLQASLFGVPSGIGEATAFPPIHPV